IARLQDIKVLNVNELAFALKPIVYPGEHMRVMINKEGKEKKQGISYLEDGTMIVIDDAKSDIGRTMDIEVTSVLQTTSGKMIFGKKV
ncbi:MAG: TRAM domain-containing protein, partial [Candidatus Aminicenantes bacterium]|nr:TRAM domain-containing protein [Candidatus Aminicenantes bacterium]